MRSCPPVFERLRRHRGLWAFALVVMLIKLAAGTVCLADGPGARAASAATAATAAWVAGDAAPASDDDGDCLLGEGDACHCACAHALTVPVTIAMTVAHWPAHFRRPTYRPALRVAANESPHRPPIA